MDRGEKEQATQDRVSESREILQSALERRADNSDCSIVEALMPPQMPADMMEQLEDRADTLAMHGSMVAETADELKEWLDIVTSDAFRKVYNQKAARLNPYFLQHERLRSKSLPITPSTLISDAARVAMVGPEDAQKVVDLLVNDLPGHVGKPYLTITRIRMAKLLSTNQQSFRLSALGDRYDDWELNSEQALSLAYLRAIDYGDEALPDTSETISLLRGVPIHPEYEYLFRAIPKLIKEQREQGETGPHSIRYLDAAVFKTLELMKYMGSEEGGSSENAQLIARLLEPRAGKGLSYKDILQIGNGLTETINKDFFEETPEAQLKRIPPDVHDGLPLAIDRILFVAAQTMQQEAREGRSGQLCSTVHSCITAMLEMGVLKNPLPKTVAIGDLWLHFPDASDAELAAIIARSRKGEGLFDPEGKPIYNPKERRRLRYRHSWNKRQGGLFT